MGEVPEPRNPCELLDEPLHLTAHERLAAGQADLRHPVVADEDPREALDLLEREQLRALKELVVPPGDLLGHAVDAGDRDPQIAQRPAQRVGVRHHDHSRSRRLPPNRQRKTRLAA
jgi:hypothetical protein